MAFKTSGSEDAAKLVARQFAFAWVGLDGGADQLRQAVANWILDTLQRADVTSDGASSETLIRVMKGLVADLPDAEPFISSNVSRNDLAAQRLARVLLGFLPAHLRSLDNLLAWIALRHPTKRKAKAPEPVPREPYGTPATDDQTKLADAISKAMLPTVFGRWPSLKRLGGDVAKALNILQKATCVGSAVDIAIWAEQVPLMAAASLEVASGIRAAFEPLKYATLGIVTSDRQLGNLVHKNFSQAVGEELALGHSDRYLIADNDAYVPPSVFPISLDAILNRRDSVKDYSVKTLLTSRGSKLTLMLRAKGTTTSREDLVVFTNDLVPKVTDSGPLDGRPELYEIKPIDSIDDAVSQIVVYSWNYLVASVFLNCAFLPTRPNSRIVNRVMIPASPEHRTIALPVITATAFAKVIGGSGDQSAEEISKFIQSLLAKKVVAGQKLAIPFMISGLYGIIPYFVIDIQQFKNVTDTVVAVVKALMAAILLYLSYKKLSKPFGNGFPEFVQAIETFVLIVVLAVVVVLALPAEVIIFGATGAALLIIMFATQDSDANTLPAENKPGTIHLGPLTAAQCSPQQLAAWMKIALSWYRESWSAKTTAASVSVAPSG